jgi:hypothetical protein
VVVVLVVAVPVVVVGGVVTLVPVSIGVVTVTVLGGSVTVLVVRSEVVDEEPHAAIAQAPITAAEPRSKRGENIP